MMNHILANVLNLKTSEKTEKSTQGKFFNKKSEKSLRQEEYVCPVTYCDPDVAEARKITGVRQYEEKKEKTYIDVIHENEVKKMCGNLGEEDKKSKYDRPFVGRIFYTFDLKKAYEKRIRDEKAKQELKRELFDALPSNW